MKTSTKLQYAMQSVDKEMESTGHGRSVVAYDADNENLVVIIFTPHGIIATKPSRVCKMYMNRFDSCYRRGCMGIPTVMEVF